MEKIQFGTGALPLSFREGRTVAVNDHMLVALERMRAALIVVAMSEATISYRDLGKATGDPYAPQGWGKALDALSEDCIRRGEPSLSSLVVRRDHGEVGDGFVGEAARERQRCYRHWRR